jgi:hypothetical protein
MACLVSGAMHLTDTLMYPYGSKGPSHPGVVARSNLNSSETNGKYCCEKEQHSCTVKVLERRERPGSCGRITVSWRVVGSYSSHVPQSDVLAFKSSKVKHDLVAFRHKFVQLCCLHWRAKQTCIRADNMERKTSTRPLIGFYIELERSADRSIE